MIRERVEELVTSEPEWSYFFEECCKTGSERLRAQAWQFYDELKSRNLKRSSGRRLAFTPAKVEDALSEIAAELLPETPAGACDPRELLFRGAVAWLSENQPAPERWADFTEGLDWYAPFGEFKEELRSRMKAATVKRVAAA